MPRSGTFRAFKNSPLNKDVWFALIPLILPILGKEKSPNLFEIQGFTSFFFLKKWCRQELSEDPALSIENKHGGYYKLQGE